MKRFALLLSSLLVACSGAAGVDVLSTSDPEPTTNVTFTPEEDSGAQSKTQVVEEDSGVQADSSTEQDAGLTDSSVVQDSGTGQDAGQDGGQVVVEPTRYGVAFDGSQGQRVVSNFPADMAGQPTVTLETWFRYDAASSQGFLFHSGAGPYMAVVTSGASTGHLATCLEGGSPCVYSVNQVTLGMWHHAAFVLDNGAFCLYYDGVESGCVASNLLVFPEVATGSGFDASGRLAIGTYGGSSLSSKSTVDEFRVSYTRRYAGNYAVPKHLTNDAQAKLTLLLDEGAGPTSPPATLYGGASWVEVVR